MSFASRDLNYEKPVEVSENTYWVGFEDAITGFHCNPYLLIDGDEAVLLDGGSRPDFSSVMMKILETRIDPKNISTLIYHHYDPDLCGSIPNLENIINNPNLRILSKSENNSFIKYYAVKSPLQSIDAFNNEFRFKSGRLLRFFHTPYAHSAGSFMTYDEQSGILFTSDICGSYDAGGEWSLYFEMNDKCLSCDTNSNKITDLFKCKSIGSSCPLVALLNFQRQVMTSNAALRNALAIIRKVKPKMIAPQHGSIIHKPDDIEFILKKLEETNDIGIDGILTDA